MFHTLLKANNFIEAFVQGLIQFVILAAVLSLFIFLFKKRDKPVTESVDLNEGAVSESTIEKEQIMTSKKPSFFKSIYQYFFNIGLNKGFKRMITVGGFAIPFIIAIVTSISWEYDSDLPVFAFFWSFFIYWILYGLIVWIAKGFQEDRGKTL